MGGLISQIKITYKFQKRCFTCFLVTLILSNIFLSGGCGLKTDKDSFIKVYKSETDKILIQHPELNYIINNTLSPDSYPFKLTSYLDTAIKMYGRDMTDRDFAYCSIMGWGVLKRFEKQHPEKYKIVIDKLEPALSKWCNKFNEGKLYLVDDFLMMMSFWTVYFNSERSVDGNRTLQLPLTGEKITSLDSKIGYGEMVVFLSALWTITCDEDSIFRDHIIDSNYLINSFGVNYYKYDKLRQLRGNSLLSVSNGWDFRSIFCVLGTGNQYFLECNKINLKYSNYYTKPNSIYYLGDLFMAITTYLSEGLHTRTCYASYYLDIIETFGNYFNINKILNDSTIHDFLLFRRYSKIIPCP